MTLSLSALAAGPRRLSIAFGALFIAGLLAACDEGPAENAGEAIDDAAEQVGDAVTD